MMAIENLHNELQHAKPDREFKDSRTKRFQILYTLLNCPEFCSKIILRSTSNIRAFDSPVKPTSNWIKHPPLEKYFNNPENVSEIV